MGLIWYYLVPIRRRVVASNIASVFPHLSARQKRRIARGALQNVTVGALELLWLSRRKREDLQRLVEVKGIDVFNRIREQGRGVVAVTAHLGNWDILACSQAAAGVPLTVVTKELSSPRLNQLWMQSRVGSGLRLLPSKGSIREIMKTLRQGEVIGLVVDQRTPKEEGGELLPFFGRDAWTTLAPAVLAARTGAALIPVFTYRRRDGTHIVSICDEIAPASSSLATMVRINVLLERWIRNHAEQWLWLHRRWLH